MWWKVEKNWMNSWQRHWTCWRRKSRLNIVWSRIQEKSSYQCTCSSHAMASMKSRRNSNPTYPHPSKYRTCMYITQTLVYAVQIIGGFPLFQGTRATFILHNVTKSNQSKEEETLNWIFLWISISFTGINTNQQDERQWTQTSSIKPIIGDPRTGWNVRSCNLETNWFIECV